MARTYQERSNNSDLSSYNDASAGTVSHRLVADDVPGIIPISITGSLAKGGTNKEIFITPSTEPNELTWDGGTYTVKLNITTAAAKSGTAIKEVILARISSDGVTTRATKSSGVITILITSTGVKTQAVTWNDGTQNPGGSLATDRLAIIIRITNGSSTSVDSYVYETNQSNENIPTPLTPNFAVSDNPAFNKVWVKKIGKVLSDIANFVDSVVTVKHSGGGGGSQSVSDAGILTDKVSVKTGKSISDLLQSTDKVTVSTSKNILETLQSTDKTQKQKQQSITDLFLTTDNLSKSTLKTILESMPLTDSTSKKVVKAVQEQLAISEQSRKGISKFILDSIITSDAAIRSASRVISETVISFADSVVLVIKKGSVSGNSMDSPSIDSSSLGIKSMDV